MPRVKRGTVRRAKRKRLLGRAKGYFLNKSKLYRAAKEAVDKALNYAFVGRRNKKRDYRRLWIVRINAAAREHSWNYRELVHGLDLAGITIDRKHLADLAVNDAPGFKVVLEQARKAFDAAPKPAVQPKPETRANG
jgi:large subunit ribosomal protein L20